MLHDHIKKELSEDKLLNMTNSCSRLIEEMIIFNTFFAFQKLSAECLSVKILTGFRYFIFIIAWLYIIIISFHTLQELTFLLKILSMLNSMYYNPFSQIYNETFY